MSDIFREVDEDLRQERYAKLWRRFGRYIIAAVVLVVVVAAAVIAWHNIRENRRTAEGARFSEALEMARTGASEQAAHAFQRLAEDAGSGYSALARLQAAAALIAAGQTGEAVGVYDRLATDGSVDRALRDLGALLAAMHRFEAADANEMLNRLAPLVVEGNPWRYSAREMQALVHYRAGEVEDARVILRGLADDPDAPAGIRARAAELLASIGEGA